MGVGRGSWVWVNVVGKKSCKIHVDLEQAREKLETALS